MNIHCGASQMCCDIIPMHYFVKMGYLGLNLVQKFIKNLSFVYFTFTNYFIRENSPFLLPCFTRWPKLIHRKWKPRKEAGAGERVEKRGWEGERKGGVAGGKEEEKHQKKLEGSKRSRRWEGGRRRNSRGLEGKGEKEKEAEEHWRSRKESRRIED